MKGLIINDLERETLLSLGEAIEVNYAELLMLIEFYCLHDSMFQVLDPDSENDKYIFQNVYESNSRRRG